MRHIRLIQVFASLAAVVALVPACTQAPVAPGETGDEEVTGGTGTGTDGGAADGATPPAKDGAPPGPAKCPYDGPPLDVSGFATCRDGGRCVPSGVVPADQRSRLAECPGGFCVAEKIIKAQGVLLPKSCKSGFGEEGRCVSTVFPDVDKQKANLPVDVCDENERCAPCFDPLGKDTGACRSVTCDAPKEPAKVFPPCCTSAGKSRAVCLPKSSLPPVAASGLAQKECPTSADLCVPSENIDPNFKGAKCKASSLLGAYDGACVSDCINMDFLTQLGTAKGNCATGSFCAPCKNPLTGAATGTPGCAP